MGSKTLSAASSITGVITGSILKYAAGMVSPLTNVGSQLLDMITNRLEHNEKRKKIDKRLKKVRALIELFPAEIKLKCKKEYAIPTEIEKKMGQGPDPHSCPSCTTTIISALGGAATAACSAAIAATGVSTGLIVGGIAGIGLYSSTTAYEEQRKANTLNQHLKTLKLAKRMLVFQLIQDGIDYGQIKSELYKELKHSGTVNKPTLSL